LLQSLEFPDDPSCVFELKLRNLSAEETYSNKDLESELLKQSETFFKTKTQPSLTFSNLVGNMYTPSLYSCLASYLISKSKDELIADSKRIVLFSYGSGFAAAMFSLVINDDCSNQKFKLDPILANLKASKHALEAHRIEIEPKLFDSYLRHRETYNKKGWFCL
jgi:hydroxymethylglutaryl-CoA synthase